MLEHVRSKVDFGGIVKGRESCREYEEQNPQKLRGEERLSAEDPRQGKPADPLALIKQGSFSSFLLDVYLRL